jgi:2,3-bisphosphoglycerate-dependent phosphoglycerate mutase
VTEPRSTLILSRHGQSVWHRENRYAGATDIDLTDAGREQARALAAWSAAEKPGAVYCSPQKRARATAEPVCTALGVQPSIVDDLREADFGIAEGRTLGELAADRPDVVERFRADPVAHPFPDAEPPGQVAVRGAAALRAIAARVAGGTALVVAHSTLLRVALCELLGVPVARYRDVFPRLDNGALTRISVGAAGPAGLLSFNVPLLPAQPA